jgi:hypothetical protein
MQCVSSKRWYLPTSPQSGKTQKNNHDTFIAVITSDRTHWGCNTEQEQISADKMLN